MKECLRICFVKCQNCNLKYKWLGIDRIKKQNSLEIYLLMMVIKMKSCEIIPNITLFLFTEKKYILYGLFRVILI